MSLLSSTELAQIQADAAAAACDQTCVIQRKTITTDGMGQATETWNTIATVNAGMRMPTAGELQNYDYMIGDKAAWTVLLPVGTSVNHQDHLVIAGQTLVVHVILTPRSYPAFLALIAAEIK